MNHLQITIFKKKYAKISKEQSQQLIQMVFQQDLKIITAAKVLNLKYSTAKNIITKFRKNKNSNVNSRIPENKRCSFQALKHNDKPKYFKILCLNGGKMEEIFQGQ